MELHERSSRQSAFKKTEQLHLTAWTFTQRYWPIYTHKYLLAHSNLYLKETHTIHQRSDMCEITSDDGSSRSGVVRKEKRAYFKRNWPLVDVIRALTVVIVHFLCLLAPFNYKWEALRFGLVLYVFTAVSITFSYHRNLAHRSFKVPKWIEYPFAYSAVFALQVKTSLLISKPN